MATTPMIAVSTLSKRPGLMNHHVFEQPILVKDGVRLVREIARLEDAIAFLDAWPPRRRDFIYEAAWRVCCEVFDGHRPLIAARNAFLGFARRANIFADLAALPGQTGANQAPLEPLE